ncbi:hypothetical protein J4434_07075 [Candidatus Woesearchaeota archaeon]|nr:hypothetical protein [Candidatus Woesearchaeota archaeon]
MASEFDWKEFLRIAGGVISTAFGMIIAGTSGGNLIQLVIGIILAGIGIALIVSK